MKTFEEAFEGTTGNGWLTKEEARHLFDLVQTWCSSDNVVIEVGSHYGRSTIVLAHAAANKGSRVIAIDPYDDSFLGVAGSGDERCAAFKANISHAGVDNLITLIRKPVEDVVGRRSAVGVMFLDGDHTTEGTRKQIEFALRCNSKVIALHDYHTKTPDGQAIVQQANTTLGHPDTVVDTLAVWVSNNPWR